MQTQRPGRPVLSRRAWLAGLAAGWAGSGLAADGPKLDADETREAEAVGAAARAAGLRPLRTVATARYLGFGDAPEDFCKDALKLCEGLADDYLKHFAAKGFDIREPKGRLSVVVLADDQGFAAFLGEPPGAAVGGVFDLETNRLVMFDNRAAGGNPLAARANTVALLHEATHQLTFNTGLLDRRGDVPKAIGEGLATYGEVRRPRGPEKVGARNVERLKLLDGAARLPVARLLVEDDLFEDEALAQVAYARSWLLVHYLLQSDEARRRALRNYLAAIRPRRHAGRRLDDAQAHLGDPNRLDAELERHRVKLSGR